VRAIITGASSGIGAAMAREFSRRGYALALLARRAELLDQLASELPDTVAIPCDVTDSAAVHDAVKRAGPIDVAIANAGVGITGYASKIIGEAEVMMRVNYFGMLYLFGAVVPAMIERGAGRFAGIASSRRRSRPCSIGLAIAPTPPTPPVAPPTPPAPGPAPNPGPPAAPSAPSAPAPTAAPSPPKQKPKPAPKPAAPAPATPAQPSGSPQPSTPGGPSTETSKPGWGKGDENHDHTGPPGAKESDEKDSDKKDSDKKP